MLNAFAAGQSGSGKASTEPPAPLIALPRNEEATRRFREFLNKRGLDWPTSIEVTALELVGTYVAAGFGVGVTLVVPGRAGPTRCGCSPVAGIPAVKLGAVWRGKRTPVMGLLLQGLRARAAKARKGA